MAFYYTQSPRIPWWCEKRSHQTSQSNGKWQFSKFTHFTRGGVLFCHDVEKFNAFQQIQWNLYKATIKFCGLSKQVVFHDREDKLDFVKTMTGKWWNLCVFIKTSSLYRFHCMSELISDTIWCRILTYCFRWWLATYSAPSAFLLLTYCQLVTTLTKVSKTLHIWNHSHINPLGQWVSFKGWAKKA